jgi:hypothetical protein
VVPAHHQELTLANVVHELMSAAYRFEIFRVGDCPTNATRRIANQLADSRPPSLGVIAENLVGTATFSRNQAAA